ncbi:uncharacterized protein LOC106153928 [Lingula anatina]|uniref:Uncharacterized protein LOC106153928 n=1 Tax=Lingula anatina TaxID=7574 RepID=A0A1S3HBX7_LINAN|nr:uncharacterized protein LOC106153928 [Lingula anatina]|eukprot:XP_013383532.1 uncharacterized protein LOC106153928 [Lingula anatina]
MAIISRTHPCTPPVSYRGKFRQPVMTVQFCGLFLCALLTSALPSQAGSPIDKLMPPEVAKSEIHVTIIKHLHGNCQAGTALGLYLGYTLPSSGDYLHPIREETFEQTIRLAQLVPEMKVYSCECCPEEKARINVRDCDLCVEQ